MKYTVPQIAKAIVALLLAALTAVGTVFADGTVEAVEFVGLVGALVTAYGVFKKTNAPA